MFYNKYLKKRGISFNNWNFPSIPSNDCFSSIIVIPAYCEFKYILNTLSSLNEQSDFDLSQLLVLVVVNNSENDSEDVIDDNFKTIELIKNFKSNYILKFIDASSKEKALPDSLKGVGYARKLGMDFGLNYSNKNTIIHCLDADTIVAKDYLRKISFAYKNNFIKALVVDFEHQKSEKKELNKHINNYEKFLKETARNIEKAGSPYGYVSLGPTITCLAETYVRIGGMVNKKATEDFYFLQKIRKFTEIYFLNEKLVFPSSRLSERVYLGTGFRMKELIKGRAIDDLYYSKKSYQILKKSIEKILSMHNKKASCLHKELLQIDDLLYDFFYNQGLFDIWDKINKESKNNNQFKLQFHKWFDNLKTLRLLKFYS